MLSRKHSLKVLFTGAVLGLTCLTALAADADVPSVYLWNSGGTSGNYAGAPAPWGNGSSKSNSQIQFDTLASLEVTSKNLNEGIRFDLKKPLDLAPYLEKNGELRMRVRFGSGNNNRFNRGGMDEEDSPDEQDGPQQRGRRGQSRNMLMPLMQPRIEDSAQRMPQFGGGGNPNWGGQRGRMSRIQSTKINNLQVMLVLENGVMATTINIPKQARGNGEQVNTSRAHADDEGWMMFSTPLSRFRKTAEASGGIKRVILTSDAEDTFYLSQIGIIVPGDKMTLAVRLSSSPVGEQQGVFRVKPGRITLVADVEPGSGDPQVLWNLDADNKNRTVPQANPNTQFTPEYGPEDDYDDMDNPDYENNQRAPGPIVDARGMVVTHSYPNEEQNYRVEVTAHDLTGKNPDIKTSVLIEVRNSD